MIVIQAKVWPHGYPPDSDYARRLGDSYDLLSVIVGNDGTGERGGRNEGGTGNYNVYLGDPERASRHWKHVGRIEGLPRSPAHRVELIRRALEIAEGAQ